MWSANATLCERHFYQDNDEADVAAENAGKMQEGDDRNARMLAADAARMKASGNAERLEILTQNLMSQGLTHAQAQEQLAKAGIDGSVPETHAPASTAIRDFFRESE